MKEAIHKHLLSELDRTGRTDTVFVLAGVAFNLAVLLINWALSNNFTSEHRDAGTDTYVIFYMFMLGAVIITTACILTLNNSRLICTKIHASLEQLYKDTDVQKYMPENISALGNKRATLSLVVVAGMGLLAVLIPLTAVYLG